MICQSKLKMLFAMGVFALGFTTSESAGELIDDVLANIKQQLPELASKLEEIFFLPEVQELVSVIESYFQQNGKIGDKQSGCQWHTPYFSICEFLDDLNACADIHKGELTDAITADLETTLTLLPLPAAQANWGWMTATRSTDKEDYFCDQAGKCPSWYYHFLRGKGAMENNSRSYIYLQYANGVGDIPGAIVFYVDEPEWETKVIDRNIDWTPFVWRTSDGEQNIYFSCSLGLFDGDGRTLDELVRLALLLSYWEVTDPEALSSLLNEEYYFLPWFMGELIDERGGFDNYCPTTKAQSPRGDDEWDFCNWYASPLLVLTDEWFYQMFDDNWSTYKRSDYFDHIMLWVSPQAPNVYIEVSWLRIRINGMVIIDYQSTTAPLIFSGNSPLDLSEYIEDCRKQYLSFPSQTCSLPSSGSPPLFAEILEEASKDYGQGWDYRYASHWCKDCEDAVDPIWPPLPNTWCTEYACYLMSKYTNLYLKCTDIFDDPHKLGVPDMWWFFWLLGQLGHQTYRISPFDKICEWNWCPYWSWDMLADAIRPGYYVGYHYTDKSGEKHWHSTLFINWVGGMGPSDSGIRRCCAAFYAIGGNQSNARVSVGTFGMKNMVDSDCEQVTCPEESKFMWGNLYNFFGKTN